MSTLFESDRGPPRLLEKIIGVNWGLVLLLTLISAIGVGVLYSGGNGSWEPWAARSAARFALGFVLLIGAALVDIRIWYRAAYPIYLAATALLVAVDLKGVRGLGAQRWLELGPLSLQPSEFMKIGLVMVLARYFSTMSHAETGQVWRLAWPAVLIALPAALVLKQPDLGTAVMLLLGSAALFFLAGVRIWKFALVSVAGAAVVPIVWGFLKDYQRRRVMTFLHPEEDSLGAGYHITQSEIALGSGGLWGKGFLAGTQSHLSFLPEKHTDFVFTMFAEEFGLIGGLVLLSLYTLVLGYGFLIGLRCRNQFGRLLALGITANFFLYVFINTAMVMGLVPVVGVPLPLISYGGTAMLALMFGFGLVISAWIHRDTWIHRSGLDL